MAKREVNPIIRDFCELRSIVSCVGALCTNLVFDNTRPDFGYMIGSKLPVDRFARVVSEEWNHTFAGLIINTEAYTSFAKHVKKTKSTARIEPTEGITIIADEEKFKSGEETETLLLPSTDKMDDVTYHYNLLFKDPVVTKACIAAVDDLEGWISIDQSYLDSIMNKQAVEIPTTNGPIILSKALFGQMRKTIGLRYRIIQENSDNQLILIQQDEPNVCIYTLIRYLI